MPDKNFIGIELKQKRIWIIEKKLDIFLHKNVRLMRLFVDENVTKIIPKESIERIYIQHPDPWPKRKHHKNRLIQHAFIDCLYAILQKGGEVRLATDHPDYAMWIVEHFLERKDFAPLFKNGFTQEPYEGHIETHFEKVNKEIGYRPYFMHFKKL